LFACVVLDLVRLVLLRQEIGGENVSEMTYRVAQKIWHNYFVRLNFTKY